MKPYRPRVVIAEDDDAFRRAVRLIVQKDCEVVGEAANGAVAVDLVEGLRPDLVLLDISMPVMNGLEAARLIRERMPDVLVIMVSSHTSAAYLNEAVRIGVHGYVPKGSAALQLPQAIHDALDGKMFSRI